ncbi:MAG: PTS system mannose/fructose/sorbose family transporter subunit IID [Gemmatimonadetes bacterium]|nr:PTS system mannose/fructose/sorbose family transporter subunit IID [Gemmatimonadota bacterium]MBI3568381.1 PTS system mannose/fructose/sorbose family transporter subunit IID [Gemmatimonadota bacterium]
MTAVPPRLPWGTRIAMLVRLLAVQGSWNYEMMLGNGIAFAVEPALRLLPGGKNGEAYRAALARQSGYFNAHPYLAGVAVGALASAELAGESPERIERFRTACCGPLGSVGDRLVWAGWLPACSLLALAAFGFGLSPAGVVFVFLGVYNLGHLALRVWGLTVGYRDGLRVASALATPVLRLGPAHVARAAALLAGIALPLAVRGVMGPALEVMELVFGAAALGAVALTRLHGRIEGWRSSIVLLAAFILFSVVR